MAADPALAELLLRRRRVTPAMVRHAEDLVLRKYSAHPLGMLLVDLGYLDEVGLAETLVELTGQPRWQARVPDAAAFRATENARPGDAIPLYQDGMTLHYAAFDPRSGDGEALRLACGARRTVANVATRTELLEARFAVEPDRITRLAAAASGTRGEERDVALQRVLGKVFVDACAIPNGTFRLTVGATAELLHGIALERRTVLTRADGEWMLGRIYEMCELGEPPVVGHGWIRMKIGTKIHDVEVSLDTVRGMRTARLEHRVGLLALRSATTPGPTALVKALAQIPPPRERAARERALVQALALAPADDPATAHDHLALTEELAAMLVDAGRVAEAGGVAARAIAVADACAPKARRIFEALALRARPRPARAAAWAALAESYDGSSPLFLAELHCEVLGLLDPATDGDAIVSRARRIVELEETAIGGRSIRSLWALRCSAIARAHRGEAVDARVEAAAALAIELEGEGGPATADHIRGAVRAAEGRFAEAVPLFRTAMGAYARIGWEARWRVALDLARAEIALGRTRDAIDLARAAVASGELDLEGREDSEAILVQAAAPRLPYR